MAEFSLPWPDSTDPGPQVGDARPITAAEYGLQYMALWSGNVISTGNRLEVTSPGANQVEVDTGYAFIAGKFYPNDTPVSLAPDSAPAATTRKDSVILQCDWTGGGATDQYTVRAITKEGTAVDYPALTQTVNVLWEERLYNYTIDDAGAITGITDMRTPVTISTEVATAMIQDDAVTADKIAAAVAGNGLVGGAGAALSVNVDGSTLEINADALRVKDGGIVEAKLGAGAVTTAKLGALAVTFAKIDNGTVDTAKITDLAVETAKIDDLAVETAKLGAGAVTNAKLDDGVKPLKGMIIMWSGTLGGASNHHPVDPDTATAINEWHIANGDTVNGVVTPDLRDRFIVGAGSSYALGATGGSATQTHAVDILSGYEDSTINVQPDGQPVAAYLHRHQVTGNTGSSDNRPPYYALTFLCYVGA